MPRPNAHRGKGGVSRASRANKSSSRRRKPTRPETPLAITPDTMVSLSPVGRAFLNNLLAAASAEAGREITSYDMLELMRRVRAELGTHKPDFTIPAHMECMKKEPPGLGKGTADPAWQVGSR